MIRIISDSKFLKVVLANNLFADVPLIRLDLEVTAGAGANLAAAVGRLTRWLNTEPGALAGIADVPQLVSAVATALQSACGHAVPAVTPRTDIARWDAALFAWEDTTTGLAAGELAVALVAAALEGRDLPDRNARVAGFRTLAGARRLTAVQRAMLETCACRDIPVLRLQQAPFAPAETPPVNGELLQFGLGCRQRRSHGLLCDSASPEALALAADANALLLKLARSGLPVPRRDPDAPTVTTMRRALRAARALGYPVSMRPAQGTGGATPRVSGDEELRAALETARQVSPEVIVEEHVPGEVHRLLVVDQRCLTAVCLETNRIVDLHAGLRALAVAAVRCAGLSVAAVDLRLTDPLGAAGEQGACILGVSPHPDLESLAAVAAPVAEAFVDWLVPDPAAARIPLAAVTGTNGKTTSCRMLNQILRQGGRVIAMTGTDFTQIGDERPTSEDQAGAGPALSLLQDRRVQAGVLEFARGGLVKQGFGLDRVDVAACTKLTGDHVDQDGVRTFEDMMTVKGQVLRAAREVLVLNADDENSMAMRRFSTAPETYGVTMHQDPAGLLNQCRRVIHLIEEEKREHIACTDADGTVPIVATGDIPATLDGRVRHNVENALFATALAVALHCDHDRIRAGLREFRSDWDMSPGRLNVHQTHGFTVILDYGHNTNGYQAVVAMLRQVFSDNRRIGIFHLNGNRANALIQAAAREAAGQFDEYVCSELRNLRREEHGEVMTLVRDTLVEEGVSAAHVHRILDPDDALRAALGMAQAGDVVAVMGRKDPDAHAIIRAWPEEPPGLEAPGDTPERQRVISF